MNLEGCLGDHCSFLILDLGRMKEFVVHTMAKVSNEGQQKLTYSRKFCLASFLKVENQMDHVRVWILGLMKRFILWMSDFLWLKINIEELKVIQPQ